MSELEVIIGGVATLPLLSYFVLDHLIYKNIIKDETLTAKAIDGINNFNEKAYLRYPVIETIYQFIFDFHDLRTK